MNRKCHLADEKEGCWERLRYFDFFPTVQCCHLQVTITYDRAVARSENPRGGALSNLVGIICPLALVEIGLTDLPKSRGAVAPLAPPAPTGLTHEYLKFQVKNFLCLLFFKQ